jgi:hypothetical protein
MEARAMDRAEKGYLESKHLGFATVAIVSLATFGLMGTNGLIGLALSVALTGTYWFIYRDQ